MRDNLESELKFYYTKSSSLYCLYNSDNDADVTLIVKRWHYLNLFAHFRGRIIVTEIQGERTIRAMRLTYNTSINRRTKRHFQSLNLNSASPSVSQKESKKWELRFNDFFVFDE